MSGHTDGVDHAGAGWLLFRSDALLCRRGGGRRRVLAPAPEDLGLAPRHRLVLSAKGVEGSPPGLAGVARLAPEAPLPEGWEPVGLRALLADLSAGERGLVARAAALVHWDGDHLCCGRCGDPTAWHTEEPGRECPGCGLRVYPAPQPAVLVAVTRSEAGREELLLARSPRFPPGRYSVIAGYVEPGESLEETARREVQEEVGLRVDHLRYFGSQPWPFPNSLMVAFTARLAGGALRLQEEEIEDAGWFAADGLPDIPPPSSLSRALIEAFRAGGLGLAPAPERAVAAPDGSGGET